jgi:hypothetical protein
MPCGQRPSRRALWRWAPGRHGLLRGDGGLSDTGAEVPSENVKTVRRIYDSWASGDLWTVRDGKAVRLDVNWDRQRAQADLGLLST